MNLRRNIPGAIAFISIAASCSPSPSDNAKAALTGLISAPVFAANPEIYDGRDVTIEGYLAILNRDLILYPNKTEADEFNYFENIAFIYDSSPDRVLGLELRNGNTNCTSHYVQLSGVGGRLEALGIQGIIEIKSIVRFETNNFTGAGVQCYP